MAAEFPDWRYCFWHMGGNADSDPWNLRLALSGDAAAWSAIVNEFNETIWSWARRAGLNREDAEDVCQSVWYLLKDRGHGIDDPRRLAGWLATTTRREAVAVAMKRSRQDRLERSLPETESASLADRSSASAFELVSGDEIASRLRSAFELLSPKCRELLPLLWAKVLSYEEIGEVLDMPIGSIGPTKQRCLSALRAEAVS